MFLDCRSDTYSHPVLVTAKSKELSKGNSYEFDTPAYLNKMMNWLDCCGQRSKVNVTLTHGNPVLVVNVMPQEDFEETALNLALIATGHGWTD